MDYIIAISDGNEYQLGEYTENGALAVEMFIKTMGDIIRRQNCALIVTNAGNYRTLAIMKNNTLIMNYKTADIPAGMRDKLDKLAERFNIE